MTNAIGNKDLVLRGDVVVQSKLWVEEVVAVVYDVAPVQIVAKAYSRVLQLVAHMTILQINEACQSVDEVIRHLAVNVEVGLARVVAIVFKVWTQSGLRNSSGNSWLGPYDMTELVALIAVPATSQNGL